MPQFPLSPKISELEGGDASVQQGTGSPSHPRAAPSLPDAVAWKSSLWEWLCSALVAASPVEQVGGVGLPGESLALPPVTVTAALGGRVVASAWRASEPPSPAQQRDSLLRGSSHSAAFPRSPGDVSQWQGWDGEPGTPGQAGSSFHAKQSQEQRWQTGQPALEQKAAKAGVAQRWLERL